MLDSLFRNMVWGGVANPMILSLVLGTALFGGFKELSCRDEIASLESRLQKKVAIKRDLASHYICVREDPSDPARELNAVATALFATVTSDREGFVVSRMPKELAVARDRWGSDRAKWIQRKIDAAKKFRQAHDADKNPSEALQAGVDLMLKVEERAWKGDISGYGELGMSVLTPSARVLIELLDRIGSKTLGSLPVNRTTVYETHPIGAALQLVESSDLVELFASQMANAQVPKIEKNAPVPPGFTEFLTGIGNSAAPISTIRLEIHPQRTWIMAFLEAFDAQGRIVGKATFDAAAFVGPISGAGTYAAMAGSSGESKLSVPSEVASRLTVVSGKLGSPPDWLARPTKVDPLSLNATFAIESMVGSEPNQCVVCDLNDLLFDDAKSCIKDGWLDVNAFRSVLDHLNPYEHVNGAGYAVWRPVDPEEPPPLNRKLLEQLATSTLESGWCDTRLLAAHAQSYSPLTGIWTSELLHRAPEIRREFSQGLTKDIYHLIGAIPDSLWEGLRAGKEATARQLGITDALGDFFNQTIAIPDLKALPDLFHHPAELYRNSEFDATPIRVIETREAVYRLIDLKTKRKSEWTTQQNGVYEAFVDAKLVNGTPTLVQAREQCEESWDQLYTFDIGTRIVQRFIIGLPDRQKAEFLIPTPVTDRTDSLRYTDLPQNLRDTTWRIQCDGALSRLRTSGG